MRLVQALLPSDVRQSVVDALRDEGYEFGLWEETSGRDYSDVLFVPAETEKVEAIIDLLREAGVERDGYIVVSDAEAVISERHETEPDPVDERGGHTVAREELEMMAAERTSQPKSELAFTALSAVIATAGLVLDSPTVIVGAMVVAPLLGPAIAASVGSIVGDTGLVRRGVGEQVVGVVFAVVSAALFAGFVRLTSRPYIDFGSLSQLTGFTDPVALVLLVALAAGAAGALSLTSDVSTALVGVAASAAIVPPSAAVGLGVAYGQVEVAVGAVVVVVTNLLSINFASLVTLWFAGYRPIHWDRPGEPGSRSREERLFTRQLVALALAVLVVTAAAAALTLDERRNARFERSATRSVEAAAAGTSVAVTDVSIRYRSRFLFREPTGVVVRAARAPPSFAADLRERIRQRTGRSVTVVVYEADQVAGPLPASRTRPRPDRRPPVDRRPVRP